MLTIVLYFGTEWRWRNNKTLFERLNVPEELRPLMNDCHVNVIELAWLTEEEAALCTSDIKVVIDYLRQVRLNNDYVPSAEVLRHVYETMDLLSELTEDGVACPFLGRSIHRYSRHSGSFDLLTLIQNALYNWVAALWRRSH